MLRRKMEGVLDEWRRTNHSSHSGLRKAILIDGARQTGKTYIVRKFGREHYDGVLEVNFFEDREAANLLGQCMTAREAVSALSLMVGHEVVPGRELLFFDEIQEAPQVITQMKFLVEDGRFDIVASGSLLGVELKDIASFPVGYVRLERMGPLDFEEFCWSQGVGEDVITAMRDAYVSRRPLPDAIHGRLVRLHRLHLIVGGMPEAVQRYIDTRYDLGAVRDVQAQVIAQYRVDISKYARGRELQVRSIFDGLPAELAKENKRFQLGSLKNKATFERFANDFAWLIAAGVAHKCNVVSEPVFPLLRTEDERKFKLYSSDTGLLLSQYPVGVAAAVLTGARDVNYGAIYENAVAQELAGAGVPLRYFRNNRKGEVDFLVEMGDCSVLPVEVKSGKDYKLHVALNNLLATEAYDMDEAVVLSEANVSSAERPGGVIWYLPLYLAFCLAERAAKKGADAQADALLRGLDARPPEF